MGAQGEWEDVAEEPDAESEEAYDQEPAEAEPEYEEPEPVRRGRPTAAPLGRPDRSFLATLSGLGFFIVALLLVLGVWPLASNVPAGAPSFTGILAIGLVLAVIIPYLWMLDDLRIRPRVLRKSHARFLAGPLIGVLAIVLFGLFNLSTGYWLLAIVTVLVLAVAQASVALFLYSMLWEE